MQLNQQATMKNKPTADPETAVAARTIDTPVGGLVLLASRQGLTGVYFAHRIDSSTLPGETCNEILDRAEQQLGEYFAHERSDFDLPLDARGTDFQQAVWRELQRIPYGQTRSYQQIAERIGRPRSVRAVGAANGANPISVIVPCHRVIGADGSLTGFGGGLTLKRRLLTGEGVLLDLS